MKRIVLAIALGCGFLLAPLKVLAIPIQFTYQTTFSSSTIPGTSAGGTYTLDVIADNGGTDLINQVWDIFDVTSAVATVGTYTASFVSPNFNYPDLFKTDNLGILTFAQFADIDGNNTDSLGPGSPHMSINLIRASNGTIGNFSVFNQQVLDVWTVSQVNGDIPAPATLALFGLGLAGLGFNRRKRA